MIAYANRRFQIAEIFIKHSTGPRRLVRGAELVTTHYRAIGLNQCDVVKRGQNPLWLCRVKANPDEGPDQTRDSVSP